MISPELEVSLNLAVGEAARRGHEYVTVEHVLYALLYNESAAKVVRACGGSIDSTRAMIEDYFREHFPESAAKPGRIPQPSVGFQRIIQRAAQHVRAAGKDKITGDNLLVSIFSERESFAAWFLKRQNINRLDVLNFISHGIVKPGAEVDEATPGPGGRPELPPSSLPADPAAGQPGEDAGEAGAPEGEDDGESAGEGEAQPRARDPLRLYAVNLCERARQGKIDPLIGRDAELERTLQVLCRRRKNNPLYVGDSGVGKTALAEGLALRIVAGEVPLALRDAEVWSLDMGALLAGSRFRGDFEQRLKNLLKALQKRPNAVLFIDEIHTVIGAGSVSGGAMDASNLLKPALGSGALRCIGSTTYKEYRQHFKNDHALARRFQKIDVDEPSVEDTVRILKGLKAKYEEHHGVTYTADALRSAAELAARHLRDRKLPDTAIDVIDEAGAAQSMLKGRAAGGDSARNIRISAAMIQGVVAKMARIPPQKVSATDRQSLKDLDQRLKAVVFGQEAAIDALAAAIKLARSGLREEEKPIGSFLFAGPTGVGKTEVAKQLAAIMGIEFVRFDMSEYMERHTVSRLIGAPPGYVGFDQGGLLTEAVTKTPHAVLLLDEIEKAHGDVQNILLQVMDHGTLTDANGRQTDFRNVVIILTTNAGARELTSGGIGFARQPGLNAGESAAVKELFSPEFRNRLDAIISFRPLTEDIILSIVDKFTGELAARLLKQKVTMTLDDEARRLIARTGFDPAYGARPLARLIQDRLKKPLADELLFGRLAGGGTVLVTVRNGELSFDITPAG